ncbi:hypothetical protein KKH36_00015 [Patescibacteria group bacterium]|nr:hypothetical protein [Patescibacteria group bacterium]
MKKNLSVKMFLMMMTLVSLSLSSCVSGYPVNVAKNEKLKLNLIKVEARSQVDESLIREMKPDQEIFGNNGEYLDFRISLIDSEGKPAVGKNLIWRTVGDNNTQIQKTDKLGVVVFWEPVGALPNSISTRKSQWGPMQNDMEVKAFVSLYKTDLKIKIPVKLYK